MNKFKVGQRVKIKATEKRGRIIQVLGKDFDDDGATVLAYSVELNDNSFKKMYTVHDLEEVKDRLTAKEKEYLSNIIKPFRGSVKNIEKCYSSISHGEHIVIRIKNNTPIFLPDFKKNTLYQNMETYVDYTLEELGL